MMRKLLALLMTAALALTMGAAAFAADDDTEVKGITINQSNRALQKGRSITLSYTIRPSDAETDVTYSSDNTDVLTVDRNGVVTAEGPGAARVYARTDNGKEDYIEIVVPGKDDNGDVYTEAGLQSSSSADTSRDGDTGTTTSRSSVSSSVPKPTSSKATTETKESGRTKISREELIEAVNASNGKTVKLKNYSAVSAASLQAAAQESKAKLQFDTMNGKSVTGRILIDPALAKDLSGDIKLGVYATSSKVKTAQDAVTEAYNTEAKVIYCEQANYGMNVTITAKVGKMSSDDLKVYTCDKNGKNPKELKVSGLKLDSKGYARFTTSTGGYLIVSNGALV